MKMLYDYILLKELVKDSKMLLPGRMTEYPEKAEVVATGPGDAYGMPESTPFKIAQTEAITVKVGDKVYFMKDRAIKVDINKKEQHYVLKEREILGVLEDAEV